MTFFRRRPSAHCPMCDTGVHHIFHVTGCTCCIPSSVPTTVYSTTADARGAIPGRRPNPERN